MADWHPHDLGPAYKWGGRYYRDCTKGRCTFYKEWDPSKDKWVKGLYKSNGGSPRRQAEDLRQRPDTSKPPELR